MFLVLLVEVVSQKTLCVPSDDFECALKGNISLKGSAAFWCPWWGWESFVVVVAGGDALEGGGGVRRWRECQCLKFVIVAVGGHGASGRMYVDCDAGGSMVGGVAYWDEDRRPQILPSLAFFCLWVCGRWVHVFWVFRCRSFKFSEAVNVWEARVVERLLCGGGGFVVWCLVCVGAVPFAQRVDVGGELVFLQFESAWWCELG